MEARFNNISSVIVKLTNRCNIRCGYCYENIVAKGSDMTTETFQKMLVSILSSTSSNKILFILHGGEPTILHTEWFDKNLSRAYEIAESYEKKIEFSIQSNLINIGEDKLKIFKKYNVSIGGSLDNPDFLSESLRPLATKALDTYNKAKALGINIGILSTINSSNLNSMTAFCTWLSSSLGVKHFKANMAYSVGTGLELFVPSAELFFNAQKDIIEFMIKSDGDFIEENLSQEIIRFFENYKGGKKRYSTLCDDQLCGAGSRVIGVTPNGDLLPCGRFAWNNEDFFLGNLESNSQEVENGFFEKVNQFQQLSPENWNQCNTCNAKEVCSFGCQAFIVRSKLKKNIECEPTLLRFEYYNDNIERLQKLYEKICNKENRKPLSPLEQKLSKLRQIIPLSQHSLIKHILDKEFEFTH